MIILSQKRFCITIVFSFSWEDSESLEKLKTMVMQIFINILLLGGGGGVGGDKKIVMVFSKVANVRTKQRKQVFCDVIHVSVL